MIAGGAGSAVVVVSIVVSRGRWWISEVAVVSGCLVVVAGGVQRWRCLGLPVADRCDDGQW